jgi:hypothetical protein
MEYNMKELYQGLAGTRAIVALFVMVLGWGITIGSTRGEATATKTTAETALAGTSANKDVLSEIKSDIRLLKDDQGEIEETLEDHGAVIGRTLIILERLAVKQGVSTVVHD